MGADSTLNMGIQLPAFLNFSPKKVQIGLAISTSVMLVILIICFATFGWIVDYSNFKCNTSLQEADCNGGKVDLAGNTKDEGNTMAGLGAVAWIFLFINLVILVIMLLGKFASAKNPMLIAALGSTALAWIFLTAGWGRFADSKGGFKGSVDFGASFAFVIIIWLCLFPYAFFWFLLFNSSNDAASDQQAQADGTPDANAYSDGSTPSYTTNNATSAPAPHAPIDNGNAKVETNLESHPESHPKSHDEQESRM